MFVLVIVHENQVWFIASFLPLQCADSFSRGGQKGHKKKKGKNLEGNVEWQVMKDKKKKLNNLGAVEYRERGGLAELPVLPSYD